MSGTPKIKVYLNGDYEASVKSAVSAAMIAAGYGSLVDVRWGHSKKDMLWNEGEEEFSAAESYDGAAEVMAERAPDFALNN